MPPNIYEISQLDDPRVNVYRNVRDADLRGRDDLFMAESELVLRRLLRMPHRLHSILLSEQKLERLRGDLERLNVQVPVYVADLKLIHEIAAFHIHRGVLAAGFRLSAEELSLDHALGDLRLQTGTAQEESLSKQEVCFLVTQGITNVDNMGAIFRNAAAFGVHGLMLDPTSCDPLYRKAIRVSMGHVLSIPYAVSPNWIDDLRRLKSEWGMTLIAAESCQDAMPLWQMPRSRRTAIIFGSEGHGLSDETLNQCDFICSIPMAKDVPSINVAVASAVVLYELHRPR